MLQDLCPVTISCARSVRSVEAFVKVSVLSIKVRQLMALAAIAMTVGGYTCAQSQITIDTSNASAWVISNGVLTVRWLPGDGRVNSIRWSAAPNVELIDQTNTN